MKVKLEDKYLTFELDAPWEKSTAEWLWSKYGEHFFKNWLGKTLMDKQRVKVTLEVKEEVERRIGTNS